MLLGGFAVAFQCDVENNRLKVTNCLLNDPLFLSQSDLFPYDDKLALKHYSCYFDQIIDVKHIIFNEN